ncbi:hypothetical protein ABTY59_32150 [Streptomyces sp. NPDC096079]|uniref:hypothetical protein n=1 Tax=Streptomyces sp. NPDC096079 TaxID=3155820 RepID=UPI00332992A0
MDVDQAQSLPVPLTAAQQAQVRAAAASTGKPVDVFLRDAVLEAAYDPFLDALEQAVNTIIRQADQIQHNYAR